MCCFGRGRLSSLELSRTRALYTGLGVIKAARRFSSSRVTSDFTILAAESIYQLSLLRVRHGRSMTDAEVDARSYFERVPALARLLLGSTNPTANQWAGSVRRGHTRKSFTRACLR